MPSDEPLPLVLIPGLGADAGVYEPQRRFFGPRLIVAPWIEPLGDDEPLESYAARMGEMIVGLPGVRGRPFHLGGVSFGGMLAAEIAERRGGREVASLLLIAAATHRRQVAPHFRAAASLGSAVPDGLLKGVLNRVVPSLFAWTQGLTPADAAELERVATRTFVAQTKWAAGAIRRWRTPAVPRCPAFRAHGRADRVIPIVETAMRPGVDLVIPGGRHLIHMSHAGLVNRWIRAVCG